LGLDGVVGLNREIDRGLSHPNLAKPQTDRERQSIVPVPVYCGCLVGPANVAPTEVMAGRTPQEALLK
jgi:hypothetical protein